MILTFVPWGLFDMRPFALAVSALALGLMVSAGVPMAQAARVKNVESCKVQAERFAKSEQRKLIAKTALLGGTSAIFIGAIMSEFNKDGKQKAKGAFGGGQIGGKGAKLRMKQNFGKAYAACQAGRKL